MKTKSKRFLPSLCIILAILTCWSCVWLAHVIWVSGDTSASASENSSNTSVAGLVENDASAKPSDDGTTANTPDTSEAKPNDNPTASVATAVDTIGSFVNKTSVVSNKATIIKRKASDKINLSSYQQANSMYLLTDTQKELAQIILSQFSLHQKDKGDTFSFEISEAITFQDYLIVDSYFMMYFGTREYAGDMFDVWNEHKIVLHLDVLRTAEKKREAVMARIDQILASFSEGSDKHKLKQIADYLDDNTTYVIDRPNAQDVLFDKKANCSALSFTFKLMANRLGIPCDICTGIVQGNGHAWNRVLLNGNYYYYDVNGYSYGKLSRYIHSKSYDCANIAINNFYACG